jgi:hypothetical protein
LNEYPPIDERYFEWLHSLVEPLDRRAKAHYWKLCGQLFKMEFVWFIDRDDNRAEDGRELRLEFIELSGDDFDRIWYEEPVSVLEVLIGLARRVSFTLDEAPSTWFWKMLDNIGIVWDNDHWWTPETRREVKLAVNKWMYREYDYNGYGGIFPLRKPHVDQRKVELWNQMSAYILEMM